MKKPPAWRCAFASALLATLPTAAFSGSCLLPDDLLAQPRPERLQNDVATQMPCYQLEAAWLLGFGVYVTSFKQLPGPIAEEYRYYEYIRAFLAGDREPKITTQADQEALLMAALALLKDDGGERYQAYRYFITRRYWRMNPEATQLSTRALRHVLALSSDPGLLKSEQDVECFIRADYPVFPVARIIETRAFRHCLEEAPE